MNRYVIFFSKSGYTKYTSHLDMLRLFKRAFRRGGVEILYSQGFNPHPKIGFAQPLSLGYSAKAEMIEFETDCEYTADILDSIAVSMPSGLKLEGISRIPEDEKRSLAAACESADYTISMPLPFYEFDYEQILANYMAQENIFAEKKSKKTKELKQVDIKSMIQKIKAYPDENFKLALDMKLDQGSKSNLSPELVIQSFIKFAGLDILRHSVEVCRNSINLPLDYELIQL